MKLLGALLAGMVAIAAMAPATPAEARSQSYFSFEYYGPGVGLRFGRYPRYYYRPYRAYPYYYRPHRGYRYYAPRASRRCSYWRGRCARSWGYHNRNYYGCTRYHGCR